jgi:hypothetical protein
MDDAGDGQSRSPPNVRVLLDGDCISGRPAVLAPALDPHRYAEAGDLLSVYQVNVRGFALVVTRIVFLKDVPGLLE